MNNELDILKKHFGEIQGVSEFKATQLCSQINDINDFVGALQVLELTLKKIHQSLSERILGTKLDDMQKRSIDASVSQLIQNCSFMGTALFGNIFNVYAGKELFEFEIANPLFILEKNGFEGVVAYIEDKREEIVAILSKIAEALLQNESANNANMYSEGIDYTKLFSL
ncbi:hypothetical protein OQH60_05450 [Campylobacter sp. MIT 21-1685]|uniref:flagellar FLiS export co-chaperone n=1 Tax=unclassified Campylobacter TaxID=2593542 RepID=UPI00224B53C5|nr:MULTISPECIES: flagellar FLiS export co-chaperone [unclassified Campylobacter]MCX2683353.1 hypothetical protein [Campylobacter sp. MIT 21-1684]MCX2751592.1 hypothetical protein [Campylobacter sp. MIT 21-1682]MCX2807791.1 hypothetical protein [Campylobacter sp. MIT 21-1685]